MCLFEICVAGAGLLNGYWILSKINVQSHSMGHKVFVTGAGGFIGANLVHSFLKHGDEVHILKRPQSVQWRLRDVRSKLKSHNVEISDQSSILKLIKKIRPEQVFHLAQYGGNPNETNSAMIKEVVIEGSSAIFEACAQTDSVKVIINAGSASEYGSKPTIMREDMLLEPNTAYGCAKAWATLYGQHLARENNVPITTLRLFSPFGPLDNVWRFIPTTIISCLRGEKLKVSEPLNVRDFIFVEDVVRAFLIASDKKHIGEIINIGFGRQMTLKSIIAIISDYIGTKPEIETGVPGRIFDRQNNAWQADISKAKNFLDWQPKFSQEEGVYKTIKWFYKNKNLYENI